MVLGRRQMQWGPLVEIPHVDVRARRREAVLDVPDVAGVACRAFFIFLLFPRAVLRRLKLLGAVAGVVVEDVLGELISRARRRGVVWLKLF